jgi:hypothetical protein
LRRKFAETLAGLPWIMRFAFVGWICVGVVAVPVVAAVDISQYSSADVLQATLFGMFESAVVSAIVGGGLGLLVGVFVYLSRGGARAVRRRRTSG